MKKKQNEFSSALEKVDLEVLKRSEQKKIVSRRDKMIEANEEKKAAVKQEAQRIEEEISRKGALKDKLGMIFSIAVVALLFLDRYYRKEGPVDFWFGVTVFLCSISFYFFYKSSK